jgi:hypothetical protein
LTADWQPAKEARAIERPGRSPEVAAVHFDMLAIAAEKAFKLWLDIAVKDLKTISQTRRS